MKRVNLDAVMTETAMAILEDEDSKIFHAFLPHGELEDKILVGTLRVNLVSEKDNTGKVFDQYVQMLEKLNIAFNRSMGAPESMRLFKILGHKARYAGNGTVSLEIELATLADGNKSILFTMLNPMVNIWGTKANIFAISAKEATETYGLGNAMRSWKKVMKTYGYNAESETKISA